MLLSRFFPLFLSFSMLSSASNSELTPLTPPANNSENVGQKLSTDYAPQFKGLSIGLNSGFIHFSTKTSWVNHIPGITNHIHGHYATTGNGGYVGAHTILGFLCFNYYLGGELTAAYNFVKGKSKDNVNYGLVFRYSLRDSYTAAVRLGYLAGRALVYIKGGATLTSRKVESQYLNSQILKHKKSSRKYTAAPMVGFGFDLALQKGISCGLEASYSPYRIDKFVYPSGASYRMKASTFDVKFKVTYKI